MAEIDIGAETYDSLADLDDADLYLGADDRFAAVWAGLDRNSKGRKLVTATRVLLRLDWKETPNVNAPPAVVRDATCEFAAALAIGYDLGTDQAAAQTVRRQKAGSVEVEFFRNFDAPDYTPPPIPKAAWTMIRPLLKVEDGTPFPGAIATGMRGWDLCTDAPPVWVGFGSRDYQC